ncbi:MAG: DUF423 domain-containing protein [Chitinophagaceae bacterium]|nr:DUF423 domain-containing protein [Chitinophagaceae bacterium]
MHKNFLLTACILGALSVILGAFGAHALKKIVPSETVITFETGVRYQFYHTFALFIVAILFEKFGGGYLVWSGYSFIAGIFLFSGSLYVLTLIKSTQSVGLEKIGIITPFGGLFFILGWVLLLIGIVKK